MQLWPEPFTCGVTVIDGTTNAVIATIPIIPKTEIIGLQGIAVDPTTNRIYVADDNNFRSR